jgi:capsular exopolysaccharide synthesis family protein
MGKITDALKKAAEERLTRIEKMDSQRQVKYEFIAKKTVQSNIDTRIVAFYDSHSPVTEQYRKLRTNIQTLKKEKPIQTVTITSSIHGEGKSITAVNLAICTAQEKGQKKVLLIDTDMRRSHIHTYLGITNESGLAEVLAEDKPVEDVLLNLKEIENLSILPAGMAKTNPAELLGSMKFDNLIAALKKKFDFIILDAPPVIPVTDTALIAPHTDGAIMVIQAGRTQKGVIQHSEGILLQAQVKLLGFILANIQYHIPAYVYRYLK